MSKSSKTVEISSLSYEQAYAELEEIVASLETNQKTLEEAIHLYERGQLLSRHCVALLEQAELRIQKLSLTSGDMLIEELF